LFERGSKKGRSESDEENFRGKEKEKKNHSFFLLFSWHTIKIELSMFFIFLM